MTGCIVCIGECMVELSPQGAAGQYGLGFAGDTMNTAWYLRQMLPAGWQVDYLTAVGTDALSDQMLAHLDAGGIGTDHVLRRADRTVGLYMIQLTDGERSFAYWRGQSAARTLAQDPDVLDAALAGADLAYVSGITLAILPPDDSARLIDRLSVWRKAGGKVVLDSNLRPRLWEDTDQMTKAVMAAAAVSDIVLPSFDDEATWFGDATPAATAQRYTAAGASQVIVKNGSGPLLALADGQTHTLPPDPVPSVIDTTAAGDSFNAGYLAVRLTGGTVVQGLTTAAALAAHVIQIRGALTTLDAATRASLIG